MVLVGVPVAYFLVPRYVNNQVQNALAKANQDLKGQLQLGPIEFTGLGVQTKDFKLLDNQNQPVVTVGRVSAQLNPAKLVSSGVAEGRWVSAIGDITLSDYCLYLTIDRYGRLNLSQLAGPKKEKKPLGAALEEYTGTISLHNGTVFFKDERDSGFAYQLNECNLSLACQAHQAAQLSGQIALNPQGSGRLAINGKLDLTKPQFRVSLAAKQVQIKHLAAYPAAAKLLTVFSGQLDGEIWAVCSAYDWADTLANLGYGGTVSLTGGEIGLKQIAEPVRQIEAKLGLASGLVTLEKFSANLAGMGLSAHGKVLTPPISRLELTAIVPRLRAEPLEKALKRKLPIVGQARVEVKAEGTFASPVITGSITTDKLVAQDQALKKAKLRFRVADGVLAIEDVHANALGGSLEGQGYVFLEKNPEVFFNLRGHDTSLAGLSPVGGYIDNFEVSLVGTSQDPVVFGSGSGIGGFSGAASMVSSASGRFLYSGGDLLLSQGQAYTTSGAVELPFGFFSLADKQFYAVVSTPSFTIPKVRIAGLGAMTGRASGKLRVSGSAADLNSLSAFGESYSADLQLDSLAITGLKGPVGLQGMQLYFPSMKGYAASGAVEASGWVGLKGQSSNLSLLGHNIDISQMIDVVDYNLPILFAGSGDVGLNWMSGGRHQTNWFSLYAQGFGGEGHKPYYAAGYGSKGAQGLGAVLFADAVPLKERRLTSDFKLFGNVSGAFAAWGPLKDLQFAYAATLNDSAISPLVGEAILAMGAGSYKDRRFNLDHNVLAWNYLPSADTLKRSYVCGETVPWVGATLAYPLQARDTDGPIKPIGGTAVVDGWIGAKAPLDYSLAFEAKGLDLAWLAQQEWVPKAGELLASGNISDGFANAAGRVYSDHRMPRLAAGTWVEAPFMVAGAPKSPYSMSAVALLSTGENRPGHMGIIDIRAAVSKHAFDGTLPEAKAIASQDWGNGAHDDWITLAGFVDGSKVNMDVTSRGWNTERALAFVPDNGKIERSLFTGDWNTDGLSVSVDMKRGLLDSLVLDGQVEMDNGYLTMGEYTVPVTNVHAQVSGGNRGLELEDVQLDSGPLHLSGTGRRNADHSWKVDLWSKDFPLAYVSRWSKSLDKLQGTGNLAVSLETHDGDLSDAAAFVGFEGKSVRWNSSPVAVAFPTVRFGGITENSEGQLRTNEDIGVRLTRSVSAYEVTIPEGVAEVSASRIVGDNLIPPSKFTMDGTVRFTPDVSGDLLSWFCGPEGPDFGMADRPFRLRLENGQLGTLMSLHGTEMDRRRMSVSGTLLAHGQWFRDHGARSKANSLQYSLNIDKLIVGRREENQPSWHGLTLEQDIDMSYTREESVGRFKVKPFRLLPRLEDRTIASGEVSASADLVLMKRSDAAQVDTNNVSLRISDLNFSELLSVFTHQQGVSKVNGLSLEATGKLVSPTFSVAVDLAKGHIGPLQIASVEGTFSGETGAESGQSELRLGDGSDTGMRLYYGKGKNLNRYLELAGHVPYRVVPPSSQTNRERSQRLEPVWTGYTLQSAGRADLAARIHDEGLGIIADLVPDIVSSKGLLEGEIGLSGDREHPGMVGHLGIKDGVIEHKQAGKITNLNVAAVFSRSVSPDQAPAQAADPKKRIYSNSFAIEKFEGLLGGAPFYVSGQADWAGDKPLTLNANVQGERLPLKWGGLFDGIANVNLGLELRSGHVAGLEQAKLFPVITGNVDLPSGSLNIGLDQLSGKAQGLDWKKIPIDYRVRLNLGDDVWVYAMGSRIRAGGELWLLPDVETNRPVLAGSLDLSRGLLSIPLYEACFRVNSGRAVFESSTMPVLEDVQAVATVSNYEVTAFVSGAYPNVRVELMSNPPLAEKNIQRLLALGSVNPSYNNMTSTTRVNPYGASDFATSDFAVGGQSLAMLGRLVASPLTQQIGRMFYLSDFSFDFTPPNDYTVKIAKAIDKNDRFLFTYTRSMKSTTGRQQSTYGIEWRIKSNLLTRIAFDQDGNWLPWFQGLWDF